MAHDYPIQFGKYLLLERIAVGGMAEVFRAIFRTIEGVEKQVGLKRILPEYSLDEEFVALFIDEARLSATLQHPNIVHVFDFGKLDRNYYLAMEYVDGPNLKHFIRKLYREQQTFPIEFAIYIIIQLLKVLDYLHRVTDSSNRPLLVIHRDISPQNILLSREGEVKITDFGIAKAASKLSKTVPGKIQGKFGYMSPEQAMGKEIDHRSDLFSLGIIFFEMLTGKRLYGGENTFIRYENVKEAKVQPVSHYRKVPEALDRIVSKMLEKDANDRYQTSAELQKDLTDFLYPANTETVMSSLAQAINAAFPKQSTAELEKQLSGSEEDKKHWWQRKGAKGEKPSSPGVPGAQNTHSYTKPPKSPESDDSADSSLEGAKSDSVPPLESIADEHPTALSGVASDKVTPTPERRNVIELSSHARSPRTGEKLGLLRRTLIAMKSKQQFVLKLLFVALAVLLVFNFSDFNPFAIKRLKRDLLASNQAKVALEEILATTQRELAELQERMLDISASQEGNASRKLKELEEEFSREQSRFATERQAMLSQINGLKAAVTEATRPCPKGMVFVGPGKFVFGSAENDPERNLGENPESLITTKAYCIDQFEFPGSPGRPPKVGVSWSEAQESCEAQGKRLCFEREWERACKGNKNSRYSYGDSWQEGVCSTESKNAKDGVLVAAGSLPQCTNDLNLFDMSGNALEWTDVSSNGVATNPVLKGGSYDRPGYWSRCAARLDAAPDSKQNAVGFRCCKDPR